MVFGYFAAVVRGLRVSFAGFGGLVAVNVAAQIQPASRVTQNQTVQNPEEVGSLYILEYRIEGAHQLPRLEIEAVYPYLGPGRTVQDVEKARAALENAYQIKGYQTVAVQVPPQQVAGGVVVLQVVEGKVGRLRTRFAVLFPGAD